VVPNGIDLEYFRPIPRAAAPSGLIFTGAMDYLPNIDAVHHFCAAILPLVRRELPSTRFYVVGLNPPAAVRRLGEIPGVVVTGTVPDVRPYYERAAVCVAPLRIGRGVQNKVLQAMAMGLPVVASTVAHRGLEAQPGRHLLVEDEPAAFAARVVALLRDPGAGHALGRQARAFVESNHAWDASCARLEVDLRLAVQADTASMGSPA
jgi:glycosyltransferase involved in cell wall biosynthesis